MDIYSVILELGQGVVWEYMVIDRVEMNIRNPIKEEGEEDYLIYSIQ